MDNRLHAWKARLLTPAGKVILLKSVLEAIATYQMSTTMLHDSILSKMQSRCLQFFWGKPSKKGICYVKWGILTKPKMGGGLGLRDLETMNKAMILKNIWKIVTDEEAIWVRILQAKYFPFLSFWKTNRIDPCTRLWIESHDTQQTNHGCTYDVYFGYKIKWSISYTITLKFIRTLNTQSRLNYKRTIYRCSNYRCPSKD